MNPFRFRRQFLLTPSRTETLPGWTALDVRGYRLYAHPDLPVTVHGGPDSPVQLMLLGFALDPRRPELDNVDLLDALASDWTGDVSSWSFTDLVGRFVLAVFTGDDVLFISDPCGLRTLEYLCEDGAVHAASQALLLEEVATLERGDRSRQLLESDYWRRNREGYLPAGLTPFEGVERLVPNHLLRASTGEQERYWPAAGNAAERTATDPTEIIRDAVERLRSSLEAAARRFPLALPVTAGLDSRMLLAAATPIQDRLFAYTLRYRHLNDRSPDVAIPSRLLAARGVRHHIVDCRAPAPETWLKVYSGNSALSHLDDWGQIAYGIEQGLPAGHVAVKGNVAEIAQLRFHYDGVVPSTGTAEQLAALVPGWQTIPAVVDSLRTWRHDAAPAAAAAGIDLDVLFHWEHLCGSWQAQSQLEWDIAQDAFTPFSDRVLLTALLRLPTRLRSAPDRTAFRAIVEAGGSDLLDEPINPDSRELRAREFLHRAVSRAKREVRARRAH